MQFRPSAIDELLATLPEDLQILALQAIKDEHDRIERGDFTEEEREMFKIVNDLGRSAGETMDSIIIGCLKDYNYAS